MKIGKEKIGAIISIFVIVIAIVGLAYAGFTFLSSGNENTIRSGQISMSYEEAEKDLEGLQTIRSITNNMLWLIRCIEAGKAAGINRPTPEEKIKTSYIR